MQCQPVNLWNTAEYQCSFTPVCLQLTCLHRVSVKRCIRVHSKRSLEKLRLFFHDKMQLAKQLFALLFRRLSLIDSTFKNDPTEGN